MKTTLLIALLGAASLAHAQAQAPSGDAARGKALFMQDGCYACHGTAGHGEPYGPRLAPKPLPFAAVLGQLRQPRANMPRYAAQFVSDQDVADIYAYLSSVPTGPKASDIALLRD
jgi:mono/diheme cytochrome c family protein